MIKILSESVLLRSCVFAASPPASPARICRYFHSLFQTPVLFFFLKLTFSPFFFALHSATLEPFHGPWAVWSAKGNRCRAFAVGVDDGGDDQRASNALGHRAVRRVCLIFVSFLFSHHASTHLHSLTASCSVCVFVVCAVCLHPTSTQCSSTADFLTVFSSHKTRRCLNTRLCSIVPSIAQRFRCYYRKRLLR